MIICLKYLFRRKKEAIVSRTWTVNRPPYSLHGRTYLRTGAWRGCNHGILILNPQFSFNLEFNHCSPSTRMVLALNLRKLLLSIVSCFLNNSAVLVKNDKFVFSFKFYDCCPYQLSVLQAERIGGLTCAERTVIVTMRHPSSQEFSLFDRYSVEEVYCRFV